MRLGRSLQNVCANEVQLILLSIVFAVVLLRVTVDEHEVAGVVNATVAGTADTGAVGCDEVVVALLIVGAKAASLRAPSADGTPVLFRLRFSMSFAAIARVEDAVLGILHSEMAGWLGLAERRKYPREDPVSASMGNSDFHRLSTETKYDGYLNRAVSKTRTIPALGT
jgi:hypothetical protein